MPANLVLSDNNFTNNPTGNIYPIAEVLFFLNSLTTNSISIIDFQDTDWQTKPDN